MTAAANVWDIFMHLTPAQICQLLYVLSAAAVLAVAVVPDTAQRLLTQYGARSPDGTSVSGASVNPKYHHGQGSETSDTNSLIRLVSYLTSFGKIPHSWFIHFYILSLSCTTFWAVQFLTKGSILGIIMTSQLSKPAPTMNMGQVVMAWFLMGLQAARRLYEYMAVLQPSSSQMWIVHWLLGNFFYVCTSVSIWIEGSESIRYHYNNGFTINSPPIKSIAASLVFAVAWVMQYRCHRHLAGLEKYSMPTDGMFRYLVCPHYTCECLLYLSIAVAAAPEGQWYNQTLLCAVLFVLVNLGVTAHGTKVWYAERFGSQVHRKWKMIPIIF